MYCNLTYYNVKISRNSVLHWVLKRPALDHENPLTDYRASLDLLMRPSKSAAFNEEISRVINHRDELKNSPLHYATQQWDQVWCGKLSRG